MLRSVGSMTAAVVILSSPAAVAQTSPVDPNAQVPVTIVGPTVQVIGTGTNGLNVRSGPSTQFSVKFLGQDGQKYTLMEGPQEADGEEWWHIQDPNNPSNDGWAVRRFLTVVQS